MESLLNLVPVILEGALILGIQVGLEVRSHVSLGQPNHVLWLALVLGTVVYRIMSPVEEVVGLGVFPVAGLSPPSDALPTSVWGSGSGSWASYPAPVPGSELLCLALLLSCMQHQLDHLLLLHLCYSLVMHTTTKKSWLQWFEARKERVRRRKVRKGRRQEEELRGGRREEGKEEERDKKRRSDLEPCRD